MGDFEDGGRPDPASARVTPKTTIEGALSGRGLREVLLFLDAVYRGACPLSLSGQALPDRLSMLMLHTSVSKHRRRHAAGTGAAGRAAVPESHLPCGVPLSLWTEF